MTREEQAFEAAFAEYWRVPVRRSPSQLAESGLIMLPERVTANAGQLSFDRSPYWREPLDCLADPLIEDVILVTGAQLGKTTFCTAAQAINLLEMQWPCLMVMPSTDMSRSFSETRLQPIIDASPQLAALKPDNHDQYKLLQMYMKTATINLVGANSPSNISSRPIGLLILDEVDKYPHHTKGEAAAINLAMERTKSYPLRKHIITSTPTTEGGAVWSFYLLGDQRKFFLPSPHAKDTWLTLGDTPEFDLIYTASGKIDIAASAKTARVLCPKTGKPIADGDKYDMLHAGEWRPTNPDASLPKRRSYQLASAYSLDITWEQLVVKYLTEKQLPFGTQNYTNSWQALPYDPIDDQETRLIPQGEYAKRHPWPEEQIKGKVMAVDVQRDHFWFAARAVLLDGRLVLLEEGKLNRYEDIEEVRESLKIDADLVGIDCGHDRNGVLAQCAKYGWTAMNGIAERKAFFHQEPGQERIRRVAAPPQMEPAYHAGNVMVPVIQWSSQAGQDLLDWCQRERRWSAACDVSDDYVIQMKSHVKKHVMRKGKSFSEWDRVGKTPDHIWDCETMCSVLFDVLDIIPK